MMSFKEALNNNIKSCKLSNFTDNYDFRRFGKKKDREKIFSIKFETLYNPCRRNSSVY